MHEYHNDVLSGLPWVGYLASTDLSSLEGVELGSNLHAFDMTGLVGHSFFCQLARSNHLLCPISIKLYLCDKYGTCRCWGV